MNTVREAWRWKHVTRAVAGSLRHLGGFPAGRRGGIAVIVAVSMIPMLLMAGGAIDFGRLYIAKSRVHYALDQALLAVGASDPAANLDDVLNNYFVANYPAARLGTATHTALVVNGSELSATATVTVQTVFLNLASIDTLSVTVEAQIVRQTTGIELALVLDNTASLSVTDLNDLKTAANNLVTTLFSGASDPNDVRVTVVPFTGTVNIDASNPASAAVVVNPVPAHEYPTNADTAWKGCVEARNSPEDEQDNYVPGDPDQGEWQPYFWEAETYYLPFGSCENSWWRPDSGVDPGFASRPTGHSGDPLFSTIPGSFEDPAMTPLPNNTPDASGLTTGPNKACPTPILPLTNVQADITTSINGMLRWDHGGTIVNVGAAWGWRALSPSLPFDQGVAYTDPNINKVMVILTDGQNEILGVDLSCSFSYLARYNSQYTAYGYVSENRLGSTNKAIAEANLNTRLTSLCDNIKGAGIEIYTITFGTVPAPFAALMQGCASSPSNYFNAPTGAQLTTTFQAIGAKLTNLRVAR